MRLSRLVIKNYRNFERVDVPLSQHTVIVGENATGKSNLLAALRLLLDPSLPERARMLRDEDFWDGLDEPIRNGESITVSVELQDFADDARNLALLSDCIVKPDPLTARITYSFEPKADLQGDPRSVDDYEYVLFGGDQRDITLGYHLRRFIVMEVLPALRDAESDLSSWRRSPLRPLLDVAKEAVQSRDPDVLPQVAKEMEEAFRAVTEIDEVRALIELIQEKLRSMVGAAHAIDPTLDVASTDPARLLRSLQLVFDGAAKRTIGEASLGAANTLYLTLRLLDIESASDDRTHTFLTVEEPEAHLHPHLQRLIYRALLREQDDDEERRRSLILTTHSPHIASVAPIESILLLRTDAKSTLAASGASAALTPTESADIERYLDVTRAEMLFARRVLFVEGDAERFLLPAFAQCLDGDFDELGVTVCSIGGTHFGPFVKLVASSCLGIPCAIVTDRDSRPNRAPRSFRRIKKILEAMGNPDGVLAEDLDADALFERAAEYGVFVGTETLELDLLDSHEGREQFAGVLREFATGPVSRQRAAELAAADEPPDDATQKSLLADIERVGKGRFAQRLAEQVTAESCPKYLADAIRYIAEA